MPLDSSSLISPSFQENSEQKMVSWVCNDTESYWSLQPMKHPLQQWCLWDDHYHPLTFCGDQTHSVTAGEHTTTHQISFKTWSQMYLRCHIIKKLWLYASYNLQYQKIYFVDDTKYHFWHHVTCVWKTGLWNSATPWESICRKNLYWPHFHTWQEI